MRIITISDFHLRSTNPINRIDNYENAAFNKLAQIFSNNCDVVIFTGDIFDSWRSRYPLTGKLVNFLLKHKNKKVFAVAGNHDQISRDKDMSSTPYGMLEAAEVITTLSDNPISIGNVDFYGCNYGEKIPVIINKSKVNILVVHRMVIKAEEDKFWFGQTNYSIAKELLRDNNFDWILSGDNHKYFIEKVDNKVLINSGSVLRTSIAQKDHIPRVVLFDTETSEMSDIILNHAKFDDIFKIEEVKIKKEQNNSLQTLKDLLNSNHNIEIDFKEIVWNSCDGEESGVKEIINEVFKE